MYIKDVLHTLIKDYDVEKTVSCLTETTYKAAKIGFTLFGASALVYWAVCDISQPGFCTLRNSTSMAINLNKIAGMF